MNIGVIFAGGVGSRMHSKEKPKQFLEIQGKPIIIHTINHFETCKDIDAVVVVCVSDWIEYLNSLIYQYRLKKIGKVVPGGITGQLSIYNGLLAAKELAGEEPSIVLIHDGVRPLINSDLLTRNIETVKRFGNCITGAIVKETIIEVLEDGTVSNLIDRSCSRVARAPQSFWLSDILSAHEKALESKKTDFIDSCSMMSHYGMELHMINGPDENIKITTPGDFYMMRSILQLKEDEQIYGLE